MKERMIKYIITQCPKEFNGRENWLGVKMTPHTPMIFVNGITEDGVETNEGFYQYQDCSQAIISTIYQRLKLHDRTTTNP